MKKGAARGLGKARRFYRRRNFTQVITYLEPQVFMYRESYAYYYLLGMSCLYTGDYAGAYSYLRRALDIDERVDAMLALAAVQLRRRQTDQALRTYLDVVDLDGRNRRARRALQWLRNLDDPEEAVAWFEDRRIRRILPPVGWYVPGWIGAIVLIAAIAALAVWGGPWIARTVSGAFAPAPRQGAEFLSADDYTARIVNPDMDARFLFTPREAERLFDRIGTAFNERRDNLVRRELNRIELSNAEATLKERARMVRDFLTVPDFTTLKDNFSYDEVTADPALYEGVYVRWRGRIANLSVGQDEIGMDLLVGYENRRVLDGIVPASLSFAVLLENDQPVEMIGRVKTRSEGIALEITSIRRLDPSELQQ